MPVVFHINENKKWQHLEKNIFNLLAEEYTDKIVVIANGEAVSHYFEYSQLVTIEKMSSSVKWVACANSLKAQELDTELLPPFIDVTTNGVIEILNRQIVGYGYIKV